LYNVHTPLKEDKRFSDKYKDFGLHPAEIKYASMIESMDYALGSILNNISENDELDNTVIIFMSDNGGLSAVARGGEKHTHNWPLKSGKGSIYEGGIRVPMIVYDPNATFGGREIDKPLIIEDFFPTILDFAKIEKYNTVQKIDGKNFKPILYNKHVDSKPLIWHYPNWWGPSGPGIGSYSAIRDGKWKLIYFHDKLELELYNLEEDIFEKNNLVSENIKVTRELSQKLTDYLIENNAQMPLLKETGLQIDWPNSLLKN
jgi:arylsulfatase A-like enzyme